MLRYITTVLWVHIRTEGIYNVFTTEKIWEFTSECLSWKKNSMIWRQFIQDDALTTLLVMQHGNVLKFDDMREQLTEDHCQSIQHLNTARRLYFINEECCKLCVHILFQPKFHQALISVTSCWAMHKLKWICFQSSNQSTASRTYYQEAKMKHAISVHLINSIVPIEDFI